MNVKQLRRLIRETIRDLNESSFSANADVDRHFNHVGVYPPKMVNAGGSRYEGEIDTGWTLGYDEKTGKVDINGQPFGSLSDAAKFYKQNKKGSPPSPRALSTNSNSYDITIVKTQHAHLEALLTELFAQGKLPLCPGAVSYRWDNDVDGLYALDQQGKAIAEGPNMHHIVNVLRRYGDVPSIPSDEFNWM